MPPEEDRATATGDLHNKISWIGSAVTEICSRTDTHTDTQTSWSQYSAPLPGRSNNHQEINKKTDKNNKISSYARMTDLDPETSILDLDLGVLKM